MDVDAVGCDDVVKFLDGDDCVEVVTVVGCCDDDVVGVDPMVVDVVAVVAGVLGIVLDELAVVEVEEVEADVDVLRVLLLVVETVGCNTTIDPYRRVGKFSS